MFLSPRLLPAINLAHVIRVTRQEKNVRLHLADGESELVHEADWERALRETVQSMTPAQPGTFALSYCDDEEGFEVIRDAVVAWAVCADGMVYYVTAEGVGGGGNGDDAILYPDGRVEHASGRWKDINGWVAFVRGPDVKLIMGN